MLFTFHWVMGTRTTPLCLYNSIFKCGWPRPLPPPLHGSKQVLQLLWDNLFMNTHRVEDPPTHKCNSHAHMHTRTVASEMAESQLNSTRVSNTHEGQRWGRSWHHLPARGSSPPHPPRSFNSRSSEKKTTKNIQTKNTRKQKQNTHTHTKKTSERRRLVQFHPRRSPFSRSQSSMRL